MFFHGISFCCALWWGTNWVRRTCRALILGIGYTSSQSYEREWYVLCGWKTHFRWIFAPGHCECPHRPFCEDQHEGWKTTADLHGVSEELVTSPAPQKAFWECSIQERNSCNTAASSLSERTCCWFEVHSVPQKILYWTSMWGTRQWTCVVRQITEGV